MKQWKFIITSTYASIPQMFQNAQVRVSKWYICQLGLFRHDTHVNPRLCLTSGTRVPLEDRRSGKHTLVQQNHHDGVDQYPTPSTAASPKQWDGMRPVTLFHRAQSEGGMLGQRARHALLGSGEWRSDLPTPSRSVDVINTTEKLYSIVTCVTPCQGDHSHDPGHIRRCRSVGGQDLVS